MSCYGNSGSHHRLSAAMNAIRTCLLTAVVAASVGCRGIEYMADGTPIVPFGNDTPTERIRTIGGEYTLSLYAWTNRMPSVQSPLSGSRGFPFYVALRVNAERRGSRPDSILVAAVTLWSANGDSLLESFPLVRADGGQPWVHSSERSLIELTNDRSKLRYATVEPESRWQPRLLVIEAGRNRILSLPPASVEATY